MQTYGTDELGAVFEKIANDLDHFLQNIIGNQAVIPSNCQVGSLHNLLEALIIARKSRDAMSAVSLLQKVSYILILVSFKDARKAVIPNIPFLCLIDLCMCCTISLNGKEVCISHPELLSNALQLACKPISM